MQLENNAWRSYPPPTPLQAPTKAIVRQAEGVEGRGPHSSHQLLQTLLSVAQLLQEATVSQLQLYNRQTLDTLVGWT